MPSIKTPDFFRKKQILLCIIIQNEKNTHFLQISSKNFKSLDGLRFNSCISISYTIKKIIQEFHS
jgi:hypothetical protein